MAALQLHCEQNCCFCSVKFRCGLTHVSRSKLLKYGKLLAVSGKGIFCSKLFQLCLLISIYLTVVFCPLSVLRGKKIAPCSEECLFLPAINDKRPHRSVCYPNQMSSLYRHKIGVHEIHFMKLLTSLANMSFWSQAFQACPACNEFTSNFLYQTSRLCVALATYFSINHILLQCLC